MTKKTKATQSKPRARIVNLTYEMVCKLLGVVVMSDDDDRTPHWVEKDAEGNVLRFYFTNQGANRLLQPSNVRRLRSDVVAGRWRNTYDAICILSTTDLVNGGHRLTALFLAWHFGEVPKEQTFECLLVERIEDASVVQFMDRGKARSDSDNLFMDPSWFPLPLAGFSKWKRPDRKIRDEVCKLVPPAVQSLIGLANGYGVHPSGKDQAGWDEVLETALKLSQEKFLRAYALMHDETGKRNTVGRYIPKRLVTVATVLDVPPSKIEQLARVREAHASVRLPERFLARVLLDGDEGTIERLADVLTKEGAKIDLKTFKASVSPSYIEKAKSLIKA